MKHPKYNFDMKTYWDTFEGLYQHGPRKHLLATLDLLNEKKVTSLLDVGCGTGPIWQLLWDASQNGDKRWDGVGFYKGTDYSPAMIEIAKENFPEGNFEVEDARKLKEENGSWDCVLLMHSLDHLDDYMAAIKEAARVSSRYVCIVLWRGFVSEDTHLNDRNMMGKKEGEEPWQDTFLHEYSKEALEEAFIQAGLFIEQVVEGEALNSDSSHYNFLYLLNHG